MPAEPAAEGVIRPDTRDPSVRVGDLPERLRRRYLVDSRGGPGLGLYLDADAPLAAFRDLGARLTTGRTDPNVVRDMVMVARHRGWSIVAVSGSRSFRREAWLAARAAGLEVRGYRADERDLQVLERRLADRRRKDAEPLPAAARARLDIAEKVVRARVPDPEEQRRIVVRARNRIADWLDRGAQFTPPARRSERERYGP